MESTEEKKENRKDVKYTVNLRAIHDCMLATSKEETRYYLMGISIKDVDGRRHYAGTDGHILVHFDEEINGEPLNEEIILKPLVKFKVDKNDGESLLYGSLQIIDDRTALLRGVDEETKVACNIIDGTYPSYERVMPEENTPRLEQYISFNADYLKVVKKVLTVNPPAPKALNNTSPCLWETVKALCNVQCVLMPMRV